MDLTGCFTPQPNVEFAAVRLCVETLQIGEEKMLARSIRNSLSDPKIGKWDLLCGYAIQFHGDGQTQQWGDWARGAAWVDAR